MTEAWSYTDYEGTVTIAYGTREEAAKTVGDAECAPELNRQPWADEFAPNDPPAKAWLENGFSVQCSGCEHTLYGDGCDDDECIPYDEEKDEFGDPPTLVIHGDLAFCSAACCERWKREREEYARKREEAKATLLEHFPTAVVDYTGVGKLSGCTGHKLVGYAVFKLPGMQHPAEWCSACRAAWSRSEGDRAVLEAAVNSVVAKK